MKHQYYFISFKKLGAKINTISIKDHDFDLKWSKVFKIENLFRFLNFSSIFFNAAICCDDSIVKLCSPLPLRRNVFLETFKSIYSHDYNGNLIGLCWILSSPWPERHNFTPLQLDKSWKIDDDWVKYFWLR